MATTFKFAQVNPAVVVGEMTSDDGGKAWAWCSVPGGTPFFTMEDPTAAGSTPGTRIVDAPACGDLKAFRAFILERFADDPADSGHGELATVAALFGVIAFLLAVVLPWVARAATMLQAVGN